MSLYDRGHKELFVLRSFVLIGSDNMCEFCENSKIVRDDCVAYGYSMHERTTILSNKKVIDTKFSTIEPFESNFQEMDFRINFCPICGRKLNGE